MSVRFSLAALAAAMFLGTAQDARAVFSPQLVGGSPVANGSNWDYAYTIHFGNTATSEYLIEPGTAPSAIPGTAIGNRGMADFVTIYDVGSADSFVSASVAAAFAGKYSITTQSTGINGPLVAPGADDSSLINITIRYIGTATPTSFDDIGAIVITTKYNTVVTGNYTSQYTQGPTANNPGNKVGESSTVDVPGVVPEPSSIALVGMGLAGLFGYGYRRRRQG